LVPERFLRIFRLQEQCRGPSKKRLNIGNGLTYKLVEGEGNAIAVVCECFCHVEVAGYITS